jgi:hypothetical protein
MKYTDNVHYDAMRGEWEERERRNLRRVGMFTAACFVSPCAIILVAEILKAVGLFGAGAVAFVGLVLMSIRDNKRGK